MSGRVAAVVVTFNRRAMLEKTIAALAGQSVELQNIIVVNNASTDGTTEFLRSCGPAIEHIQLETNTGGAGGFFTGMKRAYEAGADFVWLMDDDVFPDPDALKRLLEANRFLETSGVDPGFLASSVVGTQGEPLNVPDPDTRETSNGYSDWSRFAHLGLVKIRRATFVSILFPRSTIDRFGFPIPTMFIWGDDTEYTLRISQSRPGYLVAGSQAVHSTRVSRLDLMAETRPARAALFFYHYRNHVYIARRFWGRAAATRLLRDYAREFRRALLRREMAKAKIMVRGIRAGLRFRPAIPMPNPGPVASAARIERTAPRPADPQAQARL